MGRVLSIDPAFVVRVIHELGKRDFQNYRLMKLRYLGTALFFLSFGMIILGISTILSSQAGQVGSILSFFMLVFALGFVLNAIYLIDVVRKLGPLGAGRYTLLKELYCRKCGFSVVRPYVAGDVVGAKTNAICPRCGAPLWILAIFAIPERKIESVGIPLALGTFTRADVPFKSLWLAVLSLNELMMKAISKIVRLR